MLKETIKIKGDYGTITTNGRSEVLEIEREATEQGFVFKDYNAFNNKRGVCYIPELSDETYTYNDFLELACGRKSLAFYIFDTVDWQSPESFVMERDLVEEWECTKEIKINKK